MASKQIRITDAFQENSCGICGSEEINQYFGVNDNFIDYCGIYYSFREILSEALDIQIDHNAGRTMEICLDCKDKVVKFYHFKRKVKEQQSNKSNRAAPAKDSSTNCERRSKIVHNIYQIIENYTEKCSVATIRVNEAGKKLIIESSSSSSSLLSSSSPSQSARSEADETCMQESRQHQYETDIFNESAIMIKEEPLAELSDIIRYPHDEDNDEDNNAEGVGSENDSYSNSEFVTASTASQNLLPRAAKRPRKDEKGWASMKITKDMRNSREVLKMFQEEMFSGRITQYNDHYRVARLDFADKGERYQNDSRKFTIPEFKKIKRYQVECKKCGSKLWAQIKSTFAIKRHLDACKTQPNYTSAQLEHAQAASVSQVP